MRLLSVSARAAPPVAQALLTRVERTFQNPKLRDAALIAYKSSADAAAKGALFILTVAAARVLTPDAFGLFALGTTIGWLLAVAGDFGLQTHLARVVAQDPEGAAMPLRVWGRARLASAATGMVVLGVLLPALGVTGRRATAIFLVALTYSILGLVEFLNYLYRGLSRSDIESTLTIVQRAATLALGLAALLWRREVVALALAMLLPAVAALLWSTRLAASLAPRPDDQEVRRHRLAGSLLRHQFITEIAPIGTGVLLSALYFRIDVLLIEWWVGTEAVARYNAVFRLIDALRLFPAAVLAVMWPALCRAADLRPLARVAATVTVFGAACGALLWHGAGPLVTRVYGPAYTSAGPTLRILAVSFPLMALNYALTSQLVAGSGRRAYAAICAAALAANLALNAWLIPAWSIDGAAWATVGTELVLTGGCVLALNLRS